MGDTSHLRRAPANRILSPMAVNQIDSIVATNSRFLETRQRYLEGNTNSVVLENTRAFQIGFGVLLIMIVAFRIFVVYLLIKHRKRSSLQLAQPLVLAVLVAAGAVAIGSCYFLLPINDTFCLIRDPLIFTSLTLAGNILAARIWRILLIMTPVLQLGTADTEQRNVLARIHSAIVRIFTNLARAFSDCSVRNACSFLPLSGDKAASAGSRTRRRQSIALRQKIPLSQVFILVAFLSLPQLVLQLCILTVDKLQQRVEMGTARATSASMADAVLVYRPVCRSESGTWETWVGIILTAIPYLCTALLSLNSSHMLPRAFDETAAIIRSAKFLVSGLIVTLPSLYLIDQPDATVYLEAVLIFSLAMPPCWYIPLDKLWTVLSQEQTSPEARRFSVATLLRRSQTHDSLANIKKQQDNHEKSAKLALTIGKMYEDMGLVQKSIGLFDEALALWESDPARAHKDKIGGFTVDEIEAFSPKDLEYIIQLLIAKGRVNGTFNSNVETGQQNAAQSWLDALEIYEQAPARADFADRSIIFPIFSGLFVFLKGGKIQQDENCNFEQNLVRKFVRETKLHGDAVHYSRALAMQCEVKARLGKYKQALDIFEELKSVYDADEHSEGVSSAYGTDRSAQAFSQCALWLMQLGRKDEAIKACEYVLNDLIFQMDPKNILNTCELLLPVIRIYKPMGQEKRMRDVFESQVVQNFNKYFGKDGVTPCLPLFKPLTMLLDICHDPVGFLDIHPDAVEWLTGDENGIPPDFLDSVYTKLCWSPNSIVAELCLRLAEKLSSENGDSLAIRTLVEKGLMLSRKAKRKMTASSGKVTLPIAYEMLQPVTVDLANLAKGIGISDNSVSDLSVSNHGAVLAEAKHLPRSYTKKAPSGSSVTASRSSDGIILSSASSLRMDSNSINSSASSTSEPVLPTKMSELSTTQGRLESCVEERTEPSESSPDECAHGGDDTEEIDV